MDIDEAERIGNAATAGPWIVSSSMHLHGATAWKQFISITSTSVPNSSYPNMPGIVAHLESRASWDRNPSLKDADVAFLQYTRNHWPEIIACLRDRKQFAIRIMDLQRQLEACQADLDEMQKEKARLAREIDVAMHGDEAAPQASLCDLVHPAAQLREERDRLRAFAQQFCPKCDQCGRLLLEGHVIDGDPVGEGFRNIRSIKCPACAGC